MNIIDWMIGILAGMLHVLGYFFYIKKSLKNEVDPNGATWLMFGYGMTLLTILEFDSDAPVPLLILPILCMILAIFVAIICWNKGAIKWSKTDKEDKLAFGADLALTVLYLISALLLTKGWIDQDAKKVALLIFLVASNTTTVTAFTPLLRGTWKNPKKEHPLPWMVWSVAYLILGMATFISEGFYTELMIYPITNFICHLLVAIFSMKKK